MALLATRWHDSDSEYSIEAEYWTVDAEGAYTVRNVVGQVFNKDDEWQDELPLMDMDADYLMKTRYYGAFENAVRALERAKNLEFARATIGEQ